MKWYGSVNNRLEEDRMFCDEIKVGTGMTEYLWSDRHAYEVIAVKDQKHVTVRKLDAKHVGPAYTNQWELTSNVNNPTHEMVRRGKYWYYETTITEDMLDDEDVQTKLFLAWNNVDADELRKRGTIKRYHRAKVSFGKADYYYDYEF